MVCFDRIEELPESGKLRSCYDVTFFTAEINLVRIVMIQEQFCGIFTMHCVDLGRDLRHVKLSDCTFRRANGSFQFFHHTGTTGVSLAIMPTI